MVKIKLMIVEDDPVWMRCLTEYIGKESDIVVVKQAFTKEEALVNTTSSNVDVVLIDLKLSQDDEDLCGLEVASKLFEIGIEKMIMLTSWDEPEIILESFDRGAVNYITKISYRDIPKAVREAYAGKVSLHSDVSSILTKELRKERKLKILTQVEREIYDLQEKGMSRAKIAKLLHKSVSTVKNQYKIIRSKLGGG